MAIVFKDFGTAYLAAPLAVGGLTITVDSPSSLPVLQAGDYFYLVLQKYSDRSYVEIVKVTATAGSTYTIQRGQAGTVARAFALGDYAELRLTVDSLSEFIAQGIATKMDKSGGGDFTGLYRFLASSTPRIDVVRTSDSAVSSVALDFSASDGHRAIFGGPTGANVTASSVLLRPNGYGNSAGQVKIDKDGLVDAVALVMRGSEQRTEAGAAVRYDELGKFVPKTRTINGHDLTTDFSVTADEVFAAGGTVKRNARFDATDFQFRDASGVYGVRLAASDSLSFLQGGKTSDNPDQKLHVTGWLGKQLSEFKVYADTPLRRRVAGVDYLLYDALNKPAIADVTGLSAALLEAQSKIEELEAWPQSGSSADGSWVKHRDGTMECWKTMSGTTAQNGTTAQGIYFGYPLNPLPFPVPFVGTPDASISFMSITGGNTFWASYQAPTNSTQWPRAYPFSEQPIVGNPEVLISLSARGRWK